MKFGNRGEKLSEYASRKVLKLLNRLRSKPFFYIFASTIPFSTRVLIAKLLFNRQLGDMTDIVRIPLAKGAFFFDKNHLPDWKVFNGIFTIQEYAMDYQDATIIDIGAHKGFLSAYALNKGAKQVHMYEPASQNIEYLQKLKSEFKDNEVCLFQEGVSDKDGTLDFYIYAESWSHSLIKRENLEPKAIEHVKITSLNNVILRAAQSSKKIAIKIDAEGEEERMLLGTSDESFLLINELWVEVHKYSKADFNAIIKKMEDAGLHWSNAKKLNHHSHHLLHFNRS